MAILATNHLLYIYDSTSSRSSMRAIDEKIDDMNEIFPTEIAAVQLDNSQMITLKLKLGSFTL